MQTRLSSISMTASGEVSELARRYLPIDFYSLLNLTLSEGNALLNDYEQQKITGEKLRLHHDLLRQAFLIIRFSMFEQETFINCSRFALLRKAFFRRCRLNWRRRDIRKC